MHYNSFGKRFPLKLILLALMGTTGCEPRVVGQAGSGGSVASSGGSTNGPSPAAGGTENCDTADQAKRANYDAWLSEEGDSGALEGASFEGFARGGPDFTLTLTEGGSGTIAVGTPAAPPVADAGYLCAWEDVDCRYAALKEGGTYPIRGASFEKNRLRFEFAPNGALDPWCKLQTPHLSDSCTYAPFQSGRVEFPGTSSPSPCSIEGQSVECDWFMPLFEDGVCECTSDDCFPAVAAPGSSHAVVFDATYDAEEGTLEGSLGDLDIVLSRVGCDGAGAGGAGGACGD